MRKNYGIMQKCLPWIMLIMCCLIFIYCSYHKPVGIKDNTSAQALWEDSFSCIDEMEKSSDEIIIGIVQSQEVELRHDLAFTRSFVLDVNSNDIYEIIQTGGIYKGNAYPGIEGSPILKIGSQYLLFLERVYETPDYNDYYIISGGNQGVSLYSNNSLTAYCGYDRSILPTVYLSGQNERNSISEVVSNMKALENNLENKSVRGASDPTPVYSCYWPKDTLNYYVSVSIPTNDRNLILFGVQAWNDKVIYQSLANGRYGQIVLNETSSSIGADIVVYKNNYGNVGWIGLTRLTNTLGQSNDNYPNYDNIPEGPLAFVQISLNSAYDSQATLNYWKAVAAHEMGHGLGLSHRTDGVVLLMVDNMQTLYYQYGISEPMWVDISGLMLLYAYNR